MNDVTAFGELLIDFATKETDNSGYPLMKANPGGAPGNLLAALNAYGCSTAFIGKVGDDSFGHLLVDTLNKAGICTKGVVLDSNVFTTLAFVTFDDTGNRKFAFARKPGADTCMNFEEVDLSLIDGCKDFHFGTLSLTQEPSRSTTIKAVEYAKKAGKIVSFDPNLRKPLWDNLDRAKEEILWGLKQADIVKISDEEIEFLWGDLSTEEAVHKLIDECGITLAFITKGAEGCVYATGDGWGTVPNPTEGIKTIDTTGAGDIFGGSALSRILKNEKNLKDISLDELRAAAEFACTAASLSTQYYGGISSVVPYDTVMEYINR